MSRSGVEILWRLSRGQRRGYLAAVAALIVATALAYVPPLVIGREIDAIRGGAESLGRLSIAGLVVITATVLAGLVTYLRGRWSAYASEGITRRLRDRLYDHLQRLPCSFHDKAETGDLVQRCTSDVEMIRLLLSTQVVELGRAAVMVAVALPIMAMLDWRMTLAAICLLPIIGSFALLFFRMVRGSFAAVEETEASLTTGIHENLTGIRVVRAFARQSFELQKFERRNADHRAANRRLYYVLAIYWAVSDVLVFAQAALVLFLGAYYTGRGQITVGTWVAFQSYVMMYIWPVRQMGRILAELGKAMVSLERVAHILGAKVENGQGVRPALSRTDGAKGRVEFRDVTFHHGQVLVLDRVSFTVEPGQTLGILGPSGSGKSTILQLLLRFYDYQSGSITLDGIELSHLSRASVRRQIGVVMQEPFLYSRSLHENIALGRSDVGEEEVVEASTAAAVHDTIARFSQGYQTVIGERGITLSGGQRQRVALARALLRRPALLLLDDAFSAVDSRTEAMILRALASRSGRQTTIVVAHRLTTLMHADQLLVLEAGRVTQHGTHAQLIRTDGLYRRLWELQREETESRVLCD